MIVTGNTLKLIAGCLPYMFMYFLQSKCNAYLGHTNVLRLYIHILLAGIYSQIILNFFFLLFLKALSLALCLSMVTPSNSKLYWPQQRSYTISFVLLYWFLRDKMLVVMMGHDESLRLMEQNGRMENDWGTESNGMRMEKNGGRDETKRDWWLECYAGHETGIIPKGWRYMYMHQLWNKS